MSQAVGLADKEHARLRQMVADGKKVGECIAAFPDSTEESVRENFDFHAESLKSEMLGGDTADTSKKSGKKKAE